MNNRKHILLLLFYIGFTPIGLLSQDYHGEVYRVVEQMPIIEGCEAVENENMYKLCTQLRLKHAFYSKLIFPFDALKDETSCYVLLSFIVETDGHLSDIKIIKGVQEKCNQEALFVIESINDVPI